MSDEKPQSAELSAYAPWHPVHGYEISAIREFDEDVRWALGSNKMADGWQVVPVDLVITPQAKP